MPVRTSIVALVTLLCVLFDPQILQSQSIPHTIVKGRVLDDSTGAPLPLANVFISNSTIGAASDSYGSFELKRVPLGNHEIIASIVGYAAQAKTLRLNDTSVYEVQFRLKPQPVQLPGLEVEAKEPAEWKRDLKKFLALFFGSTPNATQCSLLNPEILDFAGDEELNRFSATARKPLEIENRALGYHIQLYLDSFIQRAFFTGSTRSAFEFVCRTRFIPLQAKDENQMKLWRENRKRTYYGSLHHFFSSLVLGKCEKDGFEVHETWGSYGPILGTKVDLDPLLSPGRNGFERKLSFSRPLQIVYDRVHETQETQIKLSGPFAIVYMDGRLADPLSITTQGFWSSQRVADILPIDYSPDD